MSDKKSAAVVQIVILIICAIAGIFYWPFILLAIALCAVFGRPIFALAIGIAADTAYGIPSYYVLHLLYIPFMLFALLMIGVSYLGKKFLSAGERRIIISR